MIQAPCEIKDEHRVVYDSLRFALEQAGAKFKGKSSCTCPFHEDKSPSMWLKKDAQGIWRATCHTQSCAFHGDVFDVMAKIEGKPIGDVLKEKTQAKQAPAEDAPKVYETIDDLVASVSGVEDVYKYTNPETGYVELIVIRRVKDGKKGFFQAKPHPGGGYSFGQPKLKKLPLYNRTRVKKAEVVLVVEGEKCVHAVEGLGSNLKMNGKRFAATTSCGGAGKAQHSDWSILEGKTVYLWPDNDAPDPKTGKRTGLEHMQQVAEILQAIGCDIRWINIESLDLPAKGDVVDFLDIIKDMSNADKANGIFQIMSMAGQKNTYIDELDSFFSRIVSGQEVPVRLPFPQTSKITQALIGGTVTIIAGDAGSSKSFMLCQCGDFWANEIDVKAAIYEAEEDRNFHAMRILAQVSKESRLTDREWIYNNPQTATEYKNANIQRVAKVSSRIWTMPLDKIPNLRDMIEWVRARAEEGYRIIAIDPITAIAHKSDKSWAEDLEFMMNVKAIAVQYNCSVVLVTHPKKGANKQKDTQYGSVDDAAGGAAFGRFCQTMLWLKFLKNDKHYTVQKTHGVQEVETCNRILCIAKSRNGSGAGRMVGFYFNPKTLMYEEKGIIVGTPEDSD